MAIKGGAVKLHRGFESGSATKLVKSLPFLLSGKKEVGVTPSSVHLWLYLILPTYRCSLSFIENVGSCTKCHFSKKKKVCGLSEAPLVAQFCNHVCALSWLA